MNKQTTFFSTNIRLCTTVAIVIGLSSSLTAPQAFGSGPCAFLNDKSELYKASYLYGEYAILRSTQDCKTQDELKSYPHIKPAQNDRESHETTDYSISIVRSKGRRVRLFRCHPTYPYTATLWYPNHKNKRLRKAYNVCQKALQQYMKQGLFKKLKTQNKSPNGSCLFGYKSRPASYVYDPKEQTALSTYWLRHGSRFLLNQRDEGVNQEVTPYWLRGHHSLLLIFNMNEENGSQGKTRYQVRTLQNTRSSNVCFIKNSIQLSRWHLQAAKRKPPSPKVASLVEKWRSDWEQSARLRTARKWMRWYHKDFYHLDSHMNKRNYTRRSQRKARKYRWFHIQTKELRLVSSSPVQLVMQFRQLYYRRDLSDHGIKTLVWKKQGTQWRIIRESWHALLNGTQPAPMPPMPATHK